MLAGGILLVLGFLIAVAVVSRYLLGISIGHVPELTGYGVSIAVFLGFSYTALTDGHITIDAFSGWRKGVGILGRGARLVSSFVALAWCILLLLAVGVRMLEYYKFGSQSTSGLPISLWIPAAVMVLGQAVHTVVVALLVPRRVRGTAPPKVAESASDISTGGGYA